MILILGLNQLNPISRVGEMPERLGVFNVIYHLFARSAIEKPEHDERSLKNIESKVERRSN